MDAARARRLVQETFQRGFDRARFESFLRELLNRFEPKPLRYQGAYIPDAFKDHVASLERIGTYAAPGGERVDLLVVQLAKHATLARARTALRNYVAHHLKKRDEKDAALVAFVSPSEPSWRFSYVRMEYATVTDDGGHVGIETQLTPARRLSYLVGEGESCHTAQSRFLEILQRTSHDPTIVELEAAFSVEAVTREFFEQYQALFLNLKEQLDTIAKRDKPVGKEFAARKIDTADFAKKLMGQVVFLYFLQKKGWLGVARGQAWGTGPRDFIRRLTRGDFGVRGNIFNDVLEPLFYDTLATDRGPEAWCTRFKCRIPFLNGGLFEPLGGYDWHATDIVLPDHVFANEEGTPAGDRGTGILDVFDRYNFTVNEAEPLEVEVAIDPEMLGKVFENLLEIRDRKSKGSFYTPREIVHYMCQESLISYLDSALGQLREPIVPESPVQGGLFSGSAPQQPSLKTAMPRTALRADLATFIRRGEQASHYETARKGGTKSYAAKLPKSIEGNAERIDDALRVITVCDPAIGSGAFPVGMMTEIVRARLALSPYLGDDPERTPYHFKRHAIQASLYGVDVDPGAVEIAKLRLWLSLVVDEDDVQSIKPLPNLDYKIVAGDSLLGYPFQTRNLKVIEGLKQAYFDSTDQEDKSRLRAGINKAIADVLAGSKRSLGYQVTFDFKLFFSEVFRDRDGFDVVIANPPYVDSETMTAAQPDYRELLTARYEAASGNWDLFVVFLELGLRQTRSNGCLTYIVPNKLLGSSYATEVRRLLGANTVEEIRDYSEVAVFENVAVYPVVVRVVKTGAHEDSIKMVVMGSLTDERLSNSIPPEVFYADPMWDRYLVEPDVLRVAMKCARHGRVDRMFPDISGAATVSEAYAIVEYLREGAGRSAKHSKRLINTGTIDRYRSLWSIYPTQYIKHRYSCPVISDDDVKKISGTRYKQAASEKIIVGGMTKVLECCFDEGCYLAGKSTTIILPGKEMPLLALLPILNSTLISFWFRVFFRSMSLAGGFLRIGPNEIRRIPLPALTSKMVGRLERGAKAILEGLERDPNADTSEQERDLDDLVYGIYEIDTKERGVIEATMAEFT